jgi:hypothetical protein
MKILNRRCETNRRCPDYGIDEYCGFCAFHWLELTDGERKILLEQRAAPTPPVPVTNVTEQHTHQNTTYNPPRSRMIDALLQAIGTLAGLLLYVVFRHFWPLR